MKKKMIYKSWLVREEEFKQMKDLYDVKGFDPIAKVVSRCSFRMKKYLPICFPHQSSMIARLGHRLDATPTIFQLRDSEIQSPSDIPTENRWWQHLLRRRIRLLRFQREAETLGAQAVIQIRIGKPWGAQKLMQSTHPFCGYKIMSYSQTQFLVTTNQARETMSCRGTLSR